MPNYAKVAAPTLQAECNADCYAHGVHVPSSQIPYIIHLDLGNRMQTVHMRMHTITSKNPTVYAASTAGDDHLS